MTNPCDEFPAQESPLPTCSRRTFLALSLGGLVGACAARSPIESPFSVGMDRPKLRAPKGTCDSHIHILEPRFAATSGWKGEPVNEASVTAYRRFQARMGTERVVIVTPSTYGVDNSATLDALDQLGKSARGVVVIDSAVPPANLRAMSERGVRGIRVNFVSPQPWGRSDEERLIATAKIAADLAWHVQIYAKAEQIAAMETTITGLPTPVVIDHLGSVDPTRNTNAEDHAAILRLLATGRAWMKLSGAYISSRVGAPHYADLHAIARGYVEAAPERMLWGSDWPHRGQARNLPDDAALLDLLLDWAPDRAQQRRILVDNPVQLYGFG